MTRYLLCNTPTSVHRVQVQDGPVTLSQEVRFAFDLVDTAELVFFLESVWKGEGGKVRQTYTATNYILTFDPANPDLERFSIIRRTNGRAIVMGMSTAHRLLHALTGKTERLVQEEEEKQP